ELLREAVPIEDFSGRIGGDDRLMHGVQEERQKPLLFLRARTLAPSASVPLPLLEHSNEKHNRAPRGGVNEVARASSTASVAGDRVPLWVPPAVWRMRAGRRGATSRERLRCAIKARGAGPCWRSSLRSPHGAADALPDRSATLARRARSAERARDRLRHTRR